MLFVLVLVLGALGWAATKMAKPTASTADQGGTFTARKSDLIVTVSEGGSIRAHKSIQYKCQVERRGAEVTILSIVPGGTYVTQEDVGIGVFAKALPRLVDPVFGGIDACQSALAVETSHEASGSDAASAPEVQDAFVAFQAEGPIVGMVKEQSTEEAFKPLFQHE